VGGEVRSCGELQLMARAYLKIIDTANKMEISELSAKTESR
jgi:hypothetical protein